MREILPISKKEKEVPLPPLKWSDNQFGGEELQIDEEIFQGDDPKEVARLLKQEIESCCPGEAVPYEALAALNDYLDRVGDDLPATRIKVLSQVRTELKKIFNSTLSPKDK